MQRIDSERGFLAFRAQLTAEVVPTARAKLRDVGEFEFAPETVLKDYQLNICSAENKIM